jgi:hypothetical protein
MSLFRLTCRLTCRLTAALAVLTLALGGCARPAASPSRPAAGPSLTIYYEDKSQVELIAPSGQRVLIDVSDPSLLSRPATASDVLLTSHLHADHYSPAFEASFPGRKLTNQAGTIELDGVTVTSIDASHDSEPVVPGAATDHVFIVEIAGFRVVHFGDIGQTALTADQMAAIGRPDIAFSTLKDVAGVGGDAGPGGDYPLALMAQANPRLLIPTDKDLSLVRRAATTWPATYSTRACVTIPMAQLPARMTVLYMGSLAPSIASLLHLTETGW